MAIAIATAIAIAMAIATATAIAMYVFYADAKDTTVRKHPVLRRIAK